MPLDIGVIGATKIAQRAMVGPSARYDETAICAVAERPRSATFAARRHIPMVHRDYATLIEHPTINTVCCERIHVIAALYADARRRLSKAIG
jgi:predicted dehydrogenase